MFITIGLKILFHTIDVLLFLTLITIYIVEKKGTKK